MIPTLRSARLLLRPYTPMLVQTAHVDWLNDKELMQYSEQQFFDHTMKSQIEYVRAEVPERLLWLICCNGKDIGSISVYVNERHKRANLGILLGAREYHGQGFAAEAWTTVIEHLFESGINKVEAGCRLDNERMRRLAVTTGMRLEAEIPGHFKVGDSYHGLALYGRFARDVFHSEWQQMWAGPYWEPKNNAGSSS